MGLETSTDQTQNVLNISREAITYIKDNGVTKRVLSGYKFGPKATETDLNTLAEAVRQNTTLTSILNLAFDLAQVGAVIKLLESISNLEKLEVVNTSLEDINIVASILKPLSLKTSFTSLTFSNCQLAGKHVPLLTEFIRDTTVRELRIINNTTMLSEDELSPITKLLNAKNKDPILVPTEQQKTAKAAPVASTSSERKSAVVSNTVNTPQSSTASEGTSLATSSSNKFSPIAENIYLKPRVVDPQFVKFLSVKPPRAKSSTEFTQVFTAPLDAFYEAVLHNTTNLVLAQNTGKILKFGFNTIPGVTDTLSLTIWGYLNTNGYLTDEGFVTFEFKTGIAQLKFADNGVKDLLEKIIEKLKKHYTKRSDVRIIDLRPKRWYREYEIILAKIQEYQSSSNTLNGLITSTAKRFDQYANELNNTSFLREVDGVIQDSNIAASYDAHLADFNNLRIKYLAALANQRLYEQKKQRLFREIRGNGYNVLPKPPSGSASKVLTASLLVDSGANLLGNHINTDPPFIIVKSKVAAMDTQTLFQFNASLVFDNSAVGNKLWLQEANRLFKHIKGRSYLVWPGIEKQFANERGSLDIDMRMNASNGDDIELAVNELGNGVGPLQVIDAYKIKSEHPRRFLFLFDRKTSEWYFYGKDGWLEAVSGKLSNAKGARLKLINQMFANMLKKHSLADLMGPEGASKQHAMFDELLCILGHNKLPATIETKIRNFLTAQSGQTRAKAKLMKELESIKAIKQEWIDDINTLTKAKNGLRKINMDTVDAWILKNTTYIVPRYMKRIGLLNRSRAPALVRELKQTPASKFITSAVFRSRLKFDDYPELDFVVINRRRLKRFEFNYVSNSRPGQETITWGKSIRRFVINSYISHKNNSRAEIILGDIMPKRSFRVEDLHTQKSMRDAGIGTWHNVVDDIEPWPKVIDTVEKKQYKLSKNRALVPLLPPGNRDAETIWFKHPKYKLSLRAVAMLTSGETEVPWYYISLQAREYKKLPDIPVPEPGLGALYESGITALPKLAVLGEWGAPTKGAINRFFDEAVDFCEEEIDKLNVKISKLKTEIASAEVEYQKLVQAIIPLRRNELNFERWQFIKKWGDPATFVDKSRENILIDPNKDPLADFLKQNQNALFFSPSPTGFHNQYGLSLTDYMKRSHPGDVIVLPTYDFKRRFTPDRYTVVTAPIPPSRVNAKPKKPVIRFVETYDITTEWKGNILGELTHTINLLPGERKALVLKKTTKLSRSLEKSTTRSKSFSSTESSSFDKNLQSELTFTLNQADTNEDRSSTQEDAQDVNQSKNEASSSNTTGWDVSAKGGFEMGGLGVSTSASYDESATSGSMSSNTSRQALNNALSQEASLISSQTKDMLDKSLNRTIKKVATETSIKNRLVISSVRSEELESSYSQEESITVENPNNGRTVNYYFHQLKNLYGTAKFLKGVNIVVDYGIEIVGGTGITDIRVFALENFNKIYVNSNKSQYAALVAAIVARKIFKHYLYDSNHAEFLHGNGAIMLADDKQSLDKGMIKTLYNLQGSDKDPRASMDAIKDALVKLQKITFAFNRVPLNPKAYQLIVKHALKSELTASLTRWTEVQNDNTFMLIQVESPDRMRWYFWARDLFSDYLDEIGQLSRLSDALIGKSFSEVKVINFRKKLMVLIVAGLGHMLSESTYAVNAPAYYVDSQVGSQPAIDNYLEDRRNIETARQQALLQHAQAKIHHGFFPPVPNESVTHLNICHEPDNPSGPTSSQSNLQAK